MHQHASVVLLIFFLEVIFLRGEMAETQWSKSIRDLVQCADGFGGKVTGGHSGPFFWVTTLSDSGPGSLRHGAQNIIINNLIFWRGGEDAIQLKYGAQRVWINHVSIGRWGDGAIDVTRGSTDVTISRSLFHHHNKVMLVGSQ
ncbi:unnamed protein product, partial [Closterium sp. NIES-53]